MMFEAGHRSPGRRSSRLEITGGVFAPMGKAVVEGDHYRVSGRWQWGSGSANCTWLCGGCTIWEEGELKRLPSGAPDRRMMVFPADQATLHDTWHVMGLKGTGSGDIEVRDIRVPRERSVSLVADAAAEVAAVLSKRGVELLRGAPTHIEVHAARPAGPCRGEVRLTRAIDRGGVTWRWDC